MNILFSIHLYYPKHGAGAESYVRSMCKELISRGHTCKILLWDCNKYRITEMYEFEGVMVFPPDEHIVDNLFRWATHVVSHLDYNQRTNFLAAKYGKPFIHIAHNDIHYPSVSQGIGRQKVIYNAKWVAEKLRYNLPSFIFPPVANPGALCKHKAKDYIMMVNLNDNKGALQFYSVAKKLPQYKFLAVRGSYDHQLLPPNPLPNLTIVDNTPYISQYFERAAVVLMPSHYESWGLVATEAMGNGIPVIANPTPGLLENLDFAGIFIPRKETRKMADKVIELMENPKEWQKWSDAGKKRYAELAPDWDGLINFMMQ